MSDRLGVPRSSGPAGPRVSVICPFYNEEAIIAAAARRMVGNLRRQFAPGEWELILVDDGSRDRSREILLETLADEAAAPVRVLSYGWNRGRGRALKTGIDAAAGSVIVTTEADCSWGDDIVRRLVDELDAHPAADFVIASPHLRGGGLVNVPPSRVALTRCGNLLIRIFLAPSVSMNTGMTRAYRRHVIQPLVVFEDGKEFHLEVLLKLLTLGFRVREIPATITWDDRRLARIGARRRSSTRIVKTIGTHLRFIAIAQPVKYFAWLSLASLLIGLGFIAAAVWMLLVAGPAVFLAIIGLIMLLFCLLFCGFSVLFSELRETLRDQWLRAYPTPHPPMTPLGEVVYPARVDGS